MFSRTWSLIKSTFHPFPVIAWYITIAYHCWNLELMEEIRKCKQYLFWINCFSELKSKFYRFIEKIYWKIQKVLLMSLIKFKFINPYSSLIFTPQTYSKLNKWKVLLSILKNLGINVEYHLIEFKLEPR